MMAQNRISVSELRQWMNTICDALEIRGVTEITVEHDAHWGVFFEDAFDFNQPAEPVVGSLSDDINDLRKEMESFQSDDVGMIVDHACHHLQGIVGYLAFACSGMVVSASDKTTGAGNA